jgi:murein DD-endopeptidase MepM/ murein hydrolase activator NlpD
VSSTLTSKGKPAQQTARNPFLETWLPAVTWGVAGALGVFLALILIFKPADVAKEMAACNPASAPIMIPTLEPSDVSMPVLAMPAQAVDSLQRELNPNTVIAYKPRREVVEYEVQMRDSIFSIANMFKLKPETILWANYELLDDNPDMIELGIVLKIPPTDGVYHEWQESDTIEKVADEYEVDSEAILLYSPNRLDITNPVIKEGQFVMVPGGQREFRQWVMPTIPRGASGTTSVLGNGGCDTGEGGAYGSGTFIFPTREHRLSGNDYWDGHLALDLAVGIGDPILASDSGLVVYSGWASGGYGYTVVIDHGNGYQTLYAHNSKTAVSCGQSVNQGNVIAFGGSTGNSTGPHLHFEVRYLGGFINPWYVLN